MTETNNKHFNGANIRKKNYKRSSNPRKCK